jgi:hypothetical protein
VIFRNLKITYSHYCSVTCRLHSNLVQSIPHLLRLYLRWSLQFGFLWLVPLIFWTQHLGYIFRCVCIVGKSAHHHGHVCPSVRMYQRGFHWRDFCGIWYRILLWKPVKKTQIWLKVGKNVRLSTWRHKCIVLFPATLTCYNSTFFEWNDIRLLG